MTKARMRGQMYIAPQEIPETPTKAPDKNISYLDRQDMIRAYQSPMYFEAPAQSYIHNATGKSVSAQHIILQKTPGKRKSDLYLVNGDYLVSTADGKKMRYAKYDFEKTFRLNEADNPVNQD